jgi:HTH-type transcriptional regulator/antitoxin HigA
MATKTMNRTASARKPLNSELYAGLFRNALPLPPRSETDNHRLIGLLAALDEREDLNAEEEAFAELLAIVIEDFEDRHYSLPAVPPEEALRALMEDRGLKHKDIAAIVGNKGLTTEILAGRRKISKDVAKRLAESLRVPVEILL